MRLLRALAGLSALLTIAVVVLGATVRATDSGLSCPDWPTCYGHWLPLPADIPPEAGYEYYQVMLEWVHRLLVGFVLAPLVLAAAAGGWRLRARVPELGTCAVLAVAVLLLQALMGGVTVLDRNSPWSVAVHLGLAALLLTILLFLYERSGESRGGDPGLRLWAGTSWAVVLAAMVSAAVVAKAGASLACPDWPLCQGALLPDLSDPYLRMQFAHRLLAGLALLAVAALYLRSRPVPAARGLAGVALLLAVATALLAGHAIYAYWPVWAQVVHQALAMLAFAHVALLLARSWPRVEAAPAVTVEGRE